MKCSSYKTLCQQKDWIFIFPNLQSEFLCFDIVVNQINLGAMAVSLGVIYGQEKRKTKANCKQKRKGWRENERGEELKRIRKCR